MNWIGESRWEPERPVVIGLVNNMSDAAMDATERQFRRVLSAAARGRSLQLRSFTLSDRRIGASGSRLDLGSAELDGLVVTGTEPRAAQLIEEPFWSDFTALVDWSREQAFPVLWSCLAAHAAVLHLDGIARHPCGGKVSGVFDCALDAPDHPFAAGMPASWRTPHSRQNALRSADLRAQGYTMLSSSAAAGVDAFAKEFASSFLFLHGHPEYGRNTLMREYQRDVKRFLSGERALYPEIPRFYFDAPTEAALRAIESRATQTDPEKTALALSRVTEATLIYHDWWSPAVTLYGNWLEQCAQKVAG